MVEFIFGNEDDVINNHDYIPKASFVILESEKGYMLVYNKYYKNWELTGGNMEHGETPGECVIRECKEESNQNISKSNLKFIGVAKYSLINAAVYYTFLEKEEPFIENDEISEILWWKPGDEIAGKIDAESIKIIELYTSALQA